MLFQLEYQTITRGTVIEITVFKQSIIYFAYEATRSGNFENGLQSEGWSLVTDQGEISTGCCTLTYIWKKYVTYDGFTITTLPAIPVDEFVFSIFVQDTTIFLPGLKGTNYELSTASNGALVWIEETFKFSNLPKFLDGSTLYQLEYQTITRGSVIEISVFKQSIIYIAYEASRRGSFESSLESEGWLLVTDQGKISTGCCTMTYIWKKYVTYNGLTIITLPSISVDDFVFTIFVQDTNIFLPGLKGANYQLSTASNGALVWIDESFRFSNLPSFLEQSILYQLEYKAVTKRTAIDILVYKKSIIYLAYEATRSGTFENSLRREGWSLVTDKSKLSTGCCAMTYIWEIYITYDGLTTVSLPEISEEEFVFLIFDQENAGGKSSGGLKLDEKNEDAFSEGSGYDVVANEDTFDEGSGNDEVTIEYEDDHDDSREGSDDGDDFGSPSFNEIAKNPERCIEKVEMVEQTTYDDEVICKHQYSEQCHKTYVTDYKPQQKEECEENFLKICFIRQKQHATQENVQVCQTPLTCKGQGNVLSLYRYIQST
jgi:hypothetical protein